MTTANKVTILRILLIPFFVVEVLYYVTQGDRNSSLAGAPLLRGGLHPRRSGRLYRAAL